MSLQSFYKSMSSGFAGDILPVDGSFIEAGKFDDSVGPVSPGIPVKVLANGLFSPLVADDSIDAIYGLFGRYVPKVGEGLTSTFGQNPANKSYPQGFLVWGYARVLVVGSAAPIRGRAVYIRNLSGTSLYPIGSFAASAVDATFTAAPNIIWTENDYDEYQIGLVRILGTTVNSGGGGGDVDVIAGPGITVVTSGSGSDIDVVGGPGITVTT